jgi:predicted nucleic acid-binding protein
MKVVIETNIFVSSFFGGKPKKVIDLWKKGNLTLCLSGEIWKGGTVGAKVQTCGSCDTIMP